ncbi:hemolymph lipopolysaccharide-binding protein-like [Augochlora pura]
MQKFPLRFLAFTIAAIFVAKFSSGQPTDCTKNNAIGIGVPGVPTCRSYVDRIGCIHYLDRCDYRVTPGLGAHKIHQREVTWNEARKLCMAEGAHLAVLDSAKKGKQFIEWIAKESIVAIWLGVHDLFEEGSWTTVTGHFADTLDNHQWAIGEPSNANNRHCGVLWHYSNGTSSEKCDATKSFICEINLCSALKPLTVSNEKIVKLNK